MRQAAARKNVDDLPLDQARKGISDLASELQERLTQRLLAYMIGISDGRDIGRYARGERVPHASTAQHLRNVYYLVSLLGSSEDDTTIQAWLTGLNPMLEDRSPATLLHEDHEAHLQAVLRAAKKFLQTG
jgi:transcriptional regulator with XRE-family HTH domain